MLTYTEKWHEYINTVHKFCTVYFFKLPIEHEN